MTLIKRDNNEETFNLLNTILANKGIDPNYHSRLFAVSKSLFYGVQRPDLVKELDKLIKNKIEKKLGTNIQLALLVYKNLRHYRAVTKSRVPSYDEKEIRKYTILSWLDEIEQWIIIKKFEVQSDIIFTAPPKRY